MVKPSPYSITDSAEQDAVNTLKSLLDSRFIKDDIRSRDKYPNIDGSLELVDEDQVPYGKIDVQVRKLKTGATKYSCETSLVAYSSVSTLPVILICVDTVNKIAFWRQLSPLMPEYKKGQRSFTIYFTEAADAIDLSGTYIQKWAEIVKDYQERIGKFPALSSEVASKLNLNGVEPQDIKLFQEFIDVVNSLLDNDFPAFKELLFPNVWKLGVGIFSTNDHWISYQIYRVPYKEPFPLVCKLEKGWLTSDDANPNAIAESHSSRETLQSPQEAGNDFVLERVKFVAEQKALPIQSRLQACDILTAFVDDYSNCLNLAPGQDIHLVSELDYALNRHLPAVCAAIASQLSDDTARFVPLNLEGISKYLQERTIETEGHEESPVFFTLSSRRVRIPQILDAVRYLLANNIRNVVRPFAKRSFPMQPGASWVWSGYTREDEIRSVVGILESCDDEYSAFVAGNRLSFPKSVYLDIDTAIWFEYEPAAESSKWPGPLIREHRIDNKIRKLPKWTVTIMHEKKSMLDFWKFPNEITIEGNNYRVFSTSTYAASFLFQQTPVSNMIYRMLLHDLEVHHGIDKISTILFA